MEYGIIPKIDQAAQNNDLLIKQVQPSSEISKLKEKDKANEIVLDDFSQIKQNEKLPKKEEKLDSISFQEVTLTNLNFGFNNQSNDFYVKAIRGESENQFPTDEMMRLKVFLQEQAKKQTAS